MRQLIPFIFSIFLLGACEDKNLQEEAHHENFKKRAVRENILDSLTAGKTYLSVYSRIYSLSEHKPHNLTITASMRNINPKDTVYITKAAYYDTQGKPIRDYFEKPIYIAPLETVEIVIDEVDQEGGSGANFVFDWKIRPGSNEPYFEGVMISTYGTQGLSFTTQGRRIE